MSTTLQVSNNAPNRSEKYFDIYANLVRVGMTNFDFTLVFGSTDDKGPGEIVTNDLGAVRVSAKLLKLLALQLAELVKAYESAIEPINLPKKMEEEIQMGARQMIEGFRAPRSE